MQQWVYTLPCCRFELLLWRRPSKAMLYSIKFRMVFPARRAWLRRRWQAMNRSRMSIKGTRDEKYTAPLVEAVYEGDSHDLAEMALSELLPHWANMLWLLGMRPMLQNLL